MRKIFIIVALLFSYLSYCQTFPIQQTLGSKTTMVKTEGSYGTTTGFTFIKNFSDTIEASSIAYVRFTPGILVRVNDTLWMRNNTASAWIKIGVGGGGGSITGGNAMTLNGTSLDWGGSMTANSIISGHNTRSVTFDSTNRFRINRSNVVRFDVSNLLTGIYSTSGASAVVLSGGSLVDILGANVDIRADSVRLFSDLGINLGSAWVVANDYVRLEPKLGRFRIDTLNHALSATAKMMTWDSVTNLVETRAIPIGVNIYNSDGTLTGDRLVNTTGHTLTFDGSTTFLSMDDVGGVINVLSTNILNLTAPDVKLVQTPTRTRDTTNYKILVRQTSDGEIFTTDWNSATPTLQQVITAGSTFTLSNTYVGANLPQKYTFNSLQGYGDAGGAGLELISTSTAASGSDQVLFRSGLSGANANSGQITYAAQFENTHTGTTSTNVAAWFNAQGGTLNYAAQFRRGAVSFGTNAVASGIIEINGGTTGTITLQPATNAGTYALTLPTDDGAPSQFLQTDGTGILSWASAPTPLELEPFGKIYNDSNWTSTTLANDFDVSGSLTATDSAGLIVLSGGPSAYTATLNLDVNQKFGLTDYFSNLEYWDVWVKVRIIQNGIIWTGMRGTQINGPSNSNAVAQINTATGQSSWQVNSASNLSTSIGDWIYIRATRTGANTSVAVRNITTNSAWITTNATYAFSGVGPQRTGQFCVGLFSGKFYVDSFAVSSLTPRNAKTLYIGTSKTQGFNASFFTRYPTRMMDNNTVVVHAGGSEVSPDWETTINEVVALNPKQVVFENPCNDQRFSISLDTTKAVMYRMERILRAAGIQVYFIDALYESNPTYNQWANVVYTTKSKDSTLYLFTPTQATGYLDVDGTHPTPFGMQIIYDNITNSNKLSGEINTNLMASNFMQNQVQVAQPFNFNITATNRNIIDGYLTLGTGVLSTGIATIPLRVRGGTNLNVWVHGNGGDQYLRFLNDAANTGVSGIIDYGTLKLQTATGVLGLSAGSSEVAINDNSAAFNFRVESDGDANNIFSDGTNNRVGIGTASPLSKLDVSASFATAITSVSTTTTLDVTHHTVLVDATSGSVTINLPAASTATRRIYVIKKIDASVNTVVIDASGGELIDGATTQTITPQWGSFTIQCSGTAWFIW